MPPIIVPDDFIVLEVRGRSAHPGEPDFLANQVLKACGLVPKNDGPRLELYRAAVPVPQFKESYRLQVERSHGTLFLVDGVKQLKLDEGRVLPYDVPNVHAKRLKLTMEGERLLEWEFDCRLIPDTSLPPGASGNGETASPKSTPLMDKSKPAFSPKSAPPPFTPVPPSPSERMPLPPSIKAAIQSSATPDKELEVTELLVLEVEIWPEQPRVYFKEKPLAELAESMSGLTQVLPILVRPFKPGEARLNLASKYQIVDGQRRWMSAQKNNTLKIRAIIVHPKDIVEQHRMSVIANMHREKHSHYEYARAVIFQYDHDRTAAQIAADFSKKSRMWAYMYLELKNLLPELFELMNPAVGAAKQLTFKFAQVLARVKKEKQLAVLEQARQEGGAHGARGVLLRLQELAEEHLSDVGHSGRKRKPGDSRVVRTVNRAIAAVGYNSQLMLETAEKFKESPPMKDQMARAAIAGQAIRAAKALREFAEEMEA